MKSIFKQSLVGLSLFSVVYLISCSDNKELSNSSVNDTSDTRYTSRFSTADAEQLYKGNAVLNAYGKGSSMQPTGRTAQELGDYTVAIEAKQFVPTSLSLTDAKIKMISTFQVSNNLTKFTDRQGKQVYTTAYSVDQSGNKIPDRVTGSASSSGDNFFVYSVIPQDGMDVKGIMRANVSDNSNLLKLLISNHSEMTVKVIFVNTTVINPGDMFANTELYPYKNGFLVYSLVKMKAAGMMAAAKMNTENLAKIQTATIDYLRKVIR